MTRNLYCIIGPSGSGKTTLAEHLAKHGYREAKSYTTRACRGGDDVNSYKFVTEDFFMQMVSRGEMLEYVEYDGCYYGTHLLSLLSSDFIIIELEGARTLRRKYKERPIRVIGLNASTDALEARLSTRSDKSVERVAEDKVRFHNLSHHSDCYISGRTIEETVDIALDYIKRCEGEVT